MQKNLLQTINLTYSHDWMLQAAFKKDSASLLQERLAVLPASDTCTSSTSGDKGCWRLYCWPRTGCCSSGVPCRTLKPPSRQRVHHPHVLHHLPSSFRNRRPWSNTLEEIWSNLELEVLFDVSKVILKFPGQRGLYF